LSHSGAPALLSPLAGWQQCDNSEQWICSRLALMQPSWLTCSETRQAGFQRAFGVRNVCHPYKDIGVLSVLGIKTTDFKCFSLNILMKMKLHRRASLGGLHYFPPLIKLKHLYLLDLYFGRNERLPWPSLSWTLWAGEDQSRHPLLKFDSRHISRKEHHQWKENHITQLSASFQGKRCTLGNMAGWALKNPRQIRFATWLPCQVHTTPPNLHLDI